MCTCVCVSTNKLCGFSLPRDTAAVILAVWLYIYTAGVLMFILFLFSLYYFLKRRKLQYTRRNGRGRVGLYV